MSMYLSKSEREKIKRDKLARQYSHVGDKSQSLKEFTKEYDAEQVEIAQRPIRAAEKRVQQATNENIELLRELNQNIASYWKQPLAELDPKKAVFDSIGEYTQGRRLTSEEKSQVTKDVFDGLRGMGITLKGGEASEKFGRFVAVLEQHGVAYDIQNIVEALDRLINLGVFVEGRDGTGFNKFETPAAPEPAPVPEPAPTFDDVLAQNSTESREGRKNLVNAAEREIAGIGIPLFREWVQHLQKDYNFTPSMSDAEYIVGSVDKGIQGMFRQNNWAFTNGENFNKARRAMVSQGRWPESMLTPVERITKEMESIPTTDYFRNREVCQRLRNAELAEAAKSKS
jgi:hypothetical protein